MPALPALPAELFGVPWPYVALDAIIAFPCQVVYFYCLAALLDLRDRRLFWAIALAVLLVVAPLRTAIPLWARNVAMVIVTIAVPLALSRGSLRQRLMVICGGWIAMTATEFPTHALWLAVSGGQELTHDALIAQGWGFVTFQSLFHIAIVILFMALVGKATQRLAGDGDGARQPSLPRGYTLASLVTVLLLFTAMAFVCYASEGTGSIFIAASVVCTALFASMLALIASAGRYSRTQRERLRAESSQRQLDDYLERYRATHDAVREISRMRHDLRNHIQAITGLARAGEWGRAKRMHEALMEKATDSSAKATAAGAAAKGGQA